MAFFEGFFLGGAVGFCWVDPDGGDSVVEAGGGLFDSFDAGKDFVDGQGAGFAVEALVGDLDDIPFPHKAATLERYRPGFDTLSLRPGMISASPDNPTVFVTD